VNVFDTRSIFRRDDRRLPRLFVSNHTAEMNITVTHNDAETEWRPVRLLDGSDDMVANVIVVGRRIRDVAREFRNNLKEIGSRYDPDPHDRQTLDVIVFHQLNDVFKRRVLRHSPGVKGHNFTNLAPPLVHEVGRNLARTEKEFEPTTPLPLGPDLATANKIALRDDADEFPRLVNHGKSTDVFFQQTFAASTIEDATPTVITFLVII
jgi:hypothetical protein